MVPSLRSRHGVRRPNLFPLLHLLHLSVLIQNANLRLDGVRHQLLALSSDETWVLLATDVELWTVQILLNIDLAAGNL